MINFSRKDKPARDHHTREAQYSAHKWKGDPDFILLPPSETNLQWEHPEISLWRVQRAKASCPASVTQRNSRFVSNFWKMKWYWPQECHETIGYYTAILIQSLCCGYCRAAGNMEMRGCKSSMISTPPQKGLSKSQTDPMGRPNIAILFF